jgi:hypothetical protein
VVLPARQDTQPGEIGPFEWILGLVKSLNIWALYTKSGSDVTLVPDLVPDLI